MRVPPPARVVVEIERTAGTVHGRIATADGTSSGFYGWLELIDGLERVVIGAPEDADGADATGGGS